MKLAPHLTSIAMLSTASPKKQIPSGNKQSPLRRFLSFSWSFIKKLNDHPVILKAGPVQFVGFGLFSAMACFVSGIAFCVFLHAKGFSNADVRKVGVLFPLLMVMIWLMARVANFAHWGADFVRNPRQHLKETGFNNQGGLIGALLWVALTGAWLGLPYLVILDGLSLSALLAQAIGRIGCYNYGCCYGTPTSLPCAVRYRNEDSKILRINPAMKDVPVHPTQLYMALANLALFIAFMLVGPFNILAGFIFAIFMMYHGIARLVFERVRGDLHQRYDPEAPRLRFSSRFSIVFASAGLLLAAYLVVRGSGYFPNAKAPGVGAIINWLFREQLFFVAMVFLASFIAFVGYGIHGRKLGTFPFTRPDGDNSGARK